MAPSKASAQTHAVIAAMGETAAKTSATLKQLQASLDLLHRVVAGVDTQPQHLRAQIDLQVTATANSVVEHDDTAKILHTLMVWLKIPDPDPGDAEQQGEEEGSNSEVDHAGRGKALPTSSRWLGDTPSSSTSVAGGGSLGGVGGGDGVGGGRPGSTWRC
jgi:hypothetical protein